MAYSTDTTSKEEIEENLKDIGFTSFFDDSYVYWVEKDGTVYSFEQYCTSSFPRCEDGYPTFDTGEIIPPILEEGIVHAKSEEEALNKIFYDS